ncbi:Protein-glutamine gamma-glutamyltransferase [Stieleria maiorica]|uniref:Protein-glutamine gamma-glutamyltransferase n=1 Tax=Stieleria maiorica TaxID=2795974 RepID=A0A5B9MSS5_9BACT|nr:transglutaminase family protein [Stieleria maiorica]QEG02078.1 Protein-glutamine gamma-glutamyltransferase [Stieleria maiorica]
MSEDNGAKIRYRIRHLTEYRYSNNVAVCQNQVRMQPVSGGNVTCERTELKIAPEPTSRDEHVDYFGNRVITFSIEAIHKSLAVDVESVVAVAANPTDDKTQSPNWESLLATSPDQMRHPKIDEHRFGSPRITPAETFRQYAESSFTPQREIVDAALDLTRRIHDEFKYDTTATTVETTTKEAFSLRAGVCQDFAHVEIACLRSMGLAARYVSGYLRTLPPPGKERLVGADESHAWVEVYAGDEIGWLGLDPTNACLVGTDHIPVCIGRDYDDVSPMRGVVLGGGTNTLKVSVDVEPIADV